MAARTSTTHAPVENCQQHRQGGQDREGEDDQALHEKDLGIARGEVLVGRGCLGGRGDGWRGGRRRKGRSSWSRHGSPRRKTSASNPAGKNKRAYTMYVSVFLCVSVCPCVV